MINDVRTSAAALYDGGWRADDREDLIIEHDLTEEEVDALCEELKRLEEQNTVKKVFETVEVVEVKVSFRDDKNVQKGVLIHELNDDEKERDCILVGYDLPSDEAELSDWMHEETAETTFIVENGVYIVRPLWYAVQEDTSDEWDYGSYDYSEAVEMLNRYRSIGLKDSLIAVIDDGVCVDEIRDVD